MNMQSISKIDHDVVIQSDHVLEEILKQAKQMNQEIIIVMDGKEMLNSKLDQQIQESIHKLLDYLTRHIIGYLEYDNNYNINEFISQIESIESNLPLKHVIHDMLEKNCEIFKNTTFIREMTPIDAGIFLVNIFKHAVLATETKDEMTKIFIGNNELQINTGYFVVTLLARQFAEHDMSCKALEKYIYDLLRFNPSIIEPLYKIMREENNVIKMNLMKEKLDSLEKKLNKTLKMYDSLLDTLINLLETMVPDKPSDKNQD